MQRNSARWLVLVVSLLVYPLIVPEFHAGLTRGARTSAAAGTPPSGHMQFTVSPMDSAADTPLTIRVSGLRTGASVRLSVTSADAAGVTWRFSSNYSASAAGSVDSASTPPAGSSPAYVGADPMGPVDFMTAGASRSKIYAWVTCPQLFKGTHTCAWSKPLHFTFTATSGQAHALVTVQRGPALPVTVSYESIAGTGFFGVFWQPPAGQNTHVGILEFGGSRGGLDAMTGAMLAARGYPTLDLAYFGEPGLPQDSVGLSLEYFAKALRWLGRQPGVNPQRIWVMGWSLGSEAALLLGVHYPNLVHGVASLAPNNVAACGTWTIGGKWACLQTPVIPVAEYDGPVFLDCGEDDSSWPSCDQARAVMAALAASHDRYPHELLDYRTAGHGIGALLPYYPGFVGFEVSAGLTGRSETANPLARASQWPKLLAFLRT